MEVPPRARIIVQPAIPFAGTRSRVDVSGTSQVSRQSIPCLCLGLRPRPNRCSLASGGLIGAAPAAARAKAPACYRFRGYRGASAPAVYASRVMLPSPMQDSLPAGWLAFTGRESNPLDRDERFPSFYVSSSSPGFTLTLRCSDFVRSRRVNRRSAGVMARTVRAQIARVAQLRALRQRGAHSGRPAFRRPSANRARSSGRRSGIKLFKFERRISGASWRMRAIACCAFSSRPASA
jgi:hypothetical protein